MSHIMDQLPSTGPMFFAVTPFASDLSADLVRFEKHLIDGLAYGPSAVFVACGTGEFSSLGLDEYARLTSVAARTVDGAVPVVAGIGYGTSLCVEFIRRAEKSGVDALLVFPPYGGNGNQDGLLAHYRAIAETTELPVIIYQRGELKIEPETAARLADVGNIVGLKDGRGDLENLRRVKTLVGDRWTYFNGMPTAELSHDAFTGIGVERYSSAVFSFLPEVAMTFFRANRDGDEATTTQLLEKFYVPFARLRDCGISYSISLIKAGLRVRGQSAGSVRPPLTDPTPEHERILSALIDDAVALATAPSIQTTR